MPDKITITAPSRLHFGLMNFGGQAEREFGGLGVMIDRPGLMLRVVPSEHFAVQGELAQRVRHFTRQWQAYHGREIELPCAIEVLSAPREHTGLGVGTQLGMAVALGLSRFFQLPSQTAIELATSVGRGQRSAVGVYGFVEGGLVVERGKLPGERISPLDAQFALPSDWRFVLFCPPAEVGLASADEVKAFAELPPVPVAVTNELARIAREELLPAAAQGDFTKFAESLYRYGHLAGECYAARQGGPYNGPRLAGIVAKLREQGVMGVGQSSWGPTIFAALPSQAASDGLLQELTAWIAAEQLHVTIASVCNTGALVT